MSRDELERIRERIDRIDGELVRLLSERAEVTRAVAGAKARRGAAVFVPHREQEVFDKLRRLNPGPLPDDAMRSIWREIMSASMALQQPLTICHFGQPGAFTHQAAKLKFGDSVDYAPSEDIGEVFAEVERGHADYGVVPIENSLDGGITDTIDAFHGTELCIVAELLLRIRHHLMAPCPRSSIRRVYSRRTVFAQCRRWITANLAGVDMVEVVSTTRAAELAREEQGAAAIGSADAAAQFGLPIVAADIEDDPSNTTRFVVVARPRFAAQRTGDDRTTVMFGVHDRPGALYDALTSFHRAGVSLTRIESRPSRRRAWEYLFFVDLVGHRDDGEVAAALADLRTHTSALEVLGSYPRARAPLNA